MRYWLLKAAAKNQQLRLKAVNPNQLPLIFRVKHPGSKGGKVWYDRHGGLRYGDRPAGTLLEIDKQERAQRGDPEFKSDQPYSWDYIEPLSINYQPVPEPPVDLQSYDTVLLNSSGGKDSQATIDYVVEMAKEQGMPLDRLVVVHADLGRVEPPGTKEMAERQATHYGLKFVAVSRGKDLLDQIEHEREMFPGRGPRFCTSDHKTSQVVKVINDYVRDHLEPQGIKRASTRGPKDRADRPRILNVLGIRGQESQKRHKEVHGWGSWIARQQDNSRKIVDRWYPLANHSVRDVWERIWAAGVEHSPEYDRGSLRHSCPFCVLAGEKHLVESARAYPELAAEYEGVEKRINEKRAARGEKPHYFQPDLSMTEIRRRAAEKDAAGAPHFSKAVCPHLFMKAAEQLGFSFAGPRKPVQKPGSRGGKVRVTPKGEVRYDVLSPGRQMDDLARQGFMHLGRGKGSRRGLPSPAAAVQSRPVVACNRCSDWHPKGRHTKGLPVTARRLTRETAGHRGRGGITAEASKVGLRAAFRDSETGTVYPLDGIHDANKLPAEALVGHDADGDAIGKPSLVSGFVDGAGKFLTRREASAAQAARKLGRERLQREDRKLAGKLRRAADGLQKRIDDALRPRFVDQTPTVRRNRIAAGATEHGWHLEGIQSVLRTLADHLDEGTLPPELRGVTTRVQVEYLLNKYTKFPRPEIYRHAIADIIGMVEKHAPTVAELPTLQAIHTRLLDADHNDGRDWTHLSPPEIDAVENVVKQLKKLREEPRHSWERPALVWSSYDDHKVHSLKQWRRFQGVGPGESEPAFNHAKEQLRAMREPRVETKEQKIAKMERALTGMKIPGYFPTPRTLSERAIDEAGLRPGMTVLEPSAGKGDMADAIREACPDCDLSTIEISSSLRPILEQKGHRLVGADTFEHHGKYDRVIMNPPFEAGGDVAHVRHCYSLLKPGGRLVAIMSESPFFREDRYATEFRDWLDDLGGISEKNPAGSFLTTEGTDRRTGVSTRLVILDAPAAMAEAV